MVLTPRRNLDHQRVDDTINDIIEAFNARVAAAQADSVAADVPALVADFNALLAKLRTAGIMEE